jgi:hypothetical protein
MDMDENLNLNENLEIDKALKEFETKSQAEQMPKTSEALKTSEIPQNNEVLGVKFETNSYKAVKYYNETETPKIIKLVMKYSGGAIKEERQAEYVLLGFMILAIAISLYLFLGGGQTQQKFSATELEQMKQMP